MNWIAANRFFERLLPFGCAAFVLSMFSFLPNKAVNNIYYAFVLFPSLLLTRQEHLKALWSSWAFRGVVFSAAYVGTMLLLSDDPGHAKRALYGVGGILAVYHLSRSVTTTLERVAWGMFLISAVYVLAQLGWMLFEQGSLARRPHFDVSWQLWVPTYVCAYVAVCATAVIPYQIERRCGWQAVLTVGFVVWLSVIMASRMGLVGMLLMTPLLLIRWTMDSSRQDLFRLFSGLAFLGLLLGVCNAFDLLDSLYARGMSYRDEIWRQVWTDYRACSAMLGCGPDFRFEVLLSGTGGMQVTPHGLYAGQLLYFGGVGLALVFLLMVLTVVEGMRFRAKWVYAFVAGCGTLTVEGGVLLTPPHDITYFLLWIPLAFTVAEVVRARNPALTDTAATTTFRRRTV